MFQGGFGKPSKMERDLAKRGTLGDDSDSDDDGLGYKKKKKKNYDDDDGLGYNKKKRKDDGPGYEKMKGSVDAPVVQAPSTGEEIAMVEVRAGEVQGYGQGGEMKRYDDKEVSALCLKKLIRSTVSILKTICLALTRPSYHAR